MAELYGPLETAGAGTIVEPRPYHETRGLCGGSSGGGHRENLSARQGHVGAAGASAAAPRRSTQAAALPGCRSCPTNDELDTTKS